MRAIITLLLCSFLSISLLAQTNVSGNILSNTTWTKENSPYVISGNIGIGSDVTLTIEPGVLVRRTGDFQILVKGAVNAQGTESDSIRIEDRNLISNYLFTFQEADLNNSAFSYLDVVSIAPNYNARPFIIRISKESSGSTAPKVSGTLLISHSSFLGVRLMTDGFNSSGKLQIEKSDLRFTTLFGAEDGSELIEIRDSEVSGSIIQTNSRNQGFIARRSVFTESEFMLGGSTFDFESVTLVDSEVTGSSGGPLTVVDSRFINSPITLPKTYLIADRSIFVVDKNIAVSDDSPLGEINVRTVIRIGRILMTNCYVDADGGTYAVHTTGYQGSTITGESKILNSTLINYNSGKTSGVVTKGVLGADSFKSFTISNTNFYAYGGNIIENSFPRPITARGNYFDDFYSIEDIEEVVYHYNDYLNLGEVDFSEFLNEPATSELLLPPSVTLQRKVEGDDFSDKLNLSFDNIDSKATELRVYSTLKDNMLDTVLIGSSQLPFSNVEIPVQGERAIAVASVDDAGDVSWFNIASNIPSNAYAIISSSTITQDQAGRLTFKVFDPDDDFLKITPIENESFTSLIDETGVRVNQLAVDGDTTFYELILPVKEGQFGQLDNIGLLVDDGINNIEFSVGSLTVLPINIIGFPQEFTFSEDDSPFALNPISIQSQDESVLFQVEIYTDGTQFGTINSQSVNLQDSLDNSAYLMRGRASDLNEILGHLTYHPGKNNDLSSSIDFNFREVGAEVSFDYSIPLSVIPVNDAPELKGVTDTVGYVGDSLGIVLDIFDPEDHHSLQVSNVNLPGWVTFNGPAYQIEDLVVKSVSADLESRLVNGKMGLPAFMTKDKIGNLYISDHQYHSIFKLDTQGVLTLYAGGLRAGDRAGTRDQALFSYPMGLVMTDDGTLYVADNSNHQVKAISPEGNVYAIGTGTRGEGDGSTAEASFNYPRLLTLTKEGNLLQSNGTTVRLIDIKESTVSTLPIDLNSSNSIISMITDHQGDILIGSFSTLVEFSENGTLVRTYGTGSNGNQDGDLSSATFSFIRALGLDKEGNILLSDQNGTVIREISTDDQVTTLKDLGAQSGNDLITESGEFLLIINNQLREIKQRYFMYGTPEESDLGENSWQLTAKDTEGVESNFNFSIDVFSNDRPEVTGEDALILVGEEDGQVELPILEIIDEESKTFLITVTRQNESSVDLGISLDDLLSLNADDKWELEGTASELNLILSDLKLFSDSFEDEVLGISIMESAGRLNQSFKYHLVAKPVNVQPEFEGQRYVEAVVGQPFEYNFQATDADKEPVAYATEGLPGWVNADSVRVLQSYLKLIYSDNLPDSIKSEISLGALRVVRDSEGNETFFAIKRPQIFRLEENGSFELFAGVENRGLKDGFRLEAEFDNPLNLLMDQDGNLIISDYQNGSLRQIDPSGIVTTLVGTEPVGLSIFGFLGQDGFKDTAKPFWILGAASDAEGNIYTAEYFSVGKYDQTGYYQTVAGKPELYFEENIIDGNALDARFNRVMDVIPLNNGSVVILEANYGLVRLLENGQVSTISGADGYGYHDGTLAESRFGGFLGGIQLESGELLLMDRDNSVLRLMNFEKNEVSTIAGVGYRGNSFGLATESALGGITDMLERSNGDILLLSIDEVALLTHSTTGISGTPTLDDVGLHKFTVKVSDGHGGVIEEEITVEVFAAPNTLPEITEISDQVAYTGDSLAIELDAKDAEDGTNLMIELDQKPEWLNYRLIKSKSEVIAGAFDGEGFYYSKREFVGPNESQFIAFDNDGNIIMSDESTNSVVKISGEGEVSLVAGSGKIGMQNGDAQSARFHYPRGIAIAPNGNIYVADGGNNLIRLIDTEGNVSTLAGTGNSGEQDGPLNEATFTDLRYMEISPDGTKLYISNQNKIRMIDLVNETASTLFSASNAGPVFNLTKDGYFLMSGYDGIYKLDSEGNLLSTYGNPNGAFNQDGVHDQVVIQSPTAIVEDDLGNIYFIENYSRLRRISTDGYVLTLGGGDYATSYKDGIEDQMEFFAIGNMEFNNGNLYIGEYKTLRKISIDIPLLYGTPLLSDVGSSEVQVRATDRRNGSVSENFMIEVLQNDRLDVSGLDTAIFIKETVNEFKFPEIQIETITTDQLEVEISVGQGVEVNLGLSDSEYFEQTEGVWLFTGGREELNDLFAGLNVYSSDWGTTILGLKFKRTGGRQSLERQIPIFVEPVNIHPVYQGEKAFEVIVGESFELTFSAVDENDDLITFNADNFPSWLIGDSTRLVLPYINTIYSRNLPDSILAKRMVDVKAIEIAPWGDTLVIDGTGNRVLKLVNGYFEVFAGTGEAGYLNGSAGEAMFNGPEALFVRANGDVLVAERQNMSLRKIDESGNVSTVLGTGPIQDWFNYSGFETGTGDPIPFWMYDVQSDKNDDLYIVQGAFLGKLTDGVYEHFSGDPNQRNRFQDAVGTLSEARYFNVQTVNVLGVDSLIVWDNQNNKIKLLANGIVETIADSDGFGFVDGSLEEAKFTFVQASERLNTGEILFYDFNNIALRVLNLETESIETIAGKGFQGEVYGEVPNVVLQQINALKQLENGDVLLGSKNKIDRLTYTVPTISGTPDFSDVGEYTFTLLISDSRGGLIEEEITINVVPPNTAPVSSEIEDIESTYGGEDLTISLFDYFSDAESADNELNYEVSTNSDESVVTTAAIQSADGILALSIQNAGTTTIEVKATDDRGEVAMATFEVSIIQAMAEISITSEEDVEEDGNPKKVTVATVPADLNFVVQYDQGSDAPAQAGTYLVTVSIDERNYYGEAEYEFTILPPNTSPEGSEIEDIEATYGDDDLVISLFDYFSDAESADSELSYEVISIDESVVTANVINSSDGILTLSIENAGETSVTVEVTDPRGESVTASFSVSIAKAQAEIHIGEVEFVNDETEKPVEVTTVPSGLNYAISYDNQTAIPATVGEYAVSVVIDEANYEGEVSTRLRILNLNPDDITLSGSTVLENAEQGTVIGTLSVSDENPADSHVFELRSGEADNDDFEVSGTELKVKSPLDFESQSGYTISVQVTDNYGASYTETFTLSVMDVNEVPTIDAVEEIEIVSGLGALTIPLTGISAGDESSQTVSLSSSVSGTVESASVTLNGDNQTAELTFQTLTDQLGSGTITITVQDNGGTDNGGIDTKTMTVNINVLAANISPVDAGSCGPGTINLTVTGADDYKWYSSPLGGESFDMGNEIEVSVSETVTYYVAGVFSGTESKLRVPVTASLYDLPATPVVTNDQGVLTVALQSGMTYQWTLDGEATDGATDNTFEPTESGDYTVTVTNENGCSAVSEVTQVVLAGIEDSISTIEALIYPVPTSEVLSLKFEEWLKAGTLIQLIGTNGVVFKTNELQQPSDHVELDVSTLPEGTHIVLVRSEDRLLRKKFIIIR